MKSAFARPIPPSMTQLPTWAIRTAAVFATVALLAMSTPVIWAAVSAGLGMMALAAMGAVGVVLFQALPWSLQRLENTLLKLRKAQARASPIEQLENDVLRRAARLQSFRRALATVGGQIESIKEMVQDRSHKDPGHVMDRQQRGLQRLTLFYTANLDRLEQAQGALEHFRSTVDRKKSEWTIALAIDDTVHLLDPNAADYLIEDLLTDEALRTVQDRFNTVFAELDIQMRSIDAPTHILVQDSSSEPFDSLSLPQKSTQRGTS